MGEGYIAVCGAPLSSKRELLRALALAKQCEPPQVEMGELEALVRLEVPLGPRSVRLVGSTSHMYDADATITRVLSGAEAVIYVIAATPPERPENSVAVKNYDAMQRRYFEQHARIAQASGKSRGAIPWVFTLSKADVSQRGAVYDQIPPDVAGEPVRCSAKDHTGIDELWRRISAMVLSLASR